MRWTTAHLAAVADARRAPAGFSLIELLIVICLMALISIFALPSITSMFKLSLDSAARELGSTIKEAYNSTIVTGRVHRLVYDFKGANYWVEIGPANVLLDTAESKEKEERRKRLSSPDAVAPPPSFTIDKSVTRKKVPLPRGVNFDDIVTQQSPDPIGGGVAYTHIFPQGLTEQTLIHLKDESDHKATLVILPLVGRTDLYGRYVTGAEAFGKQ